MSPVIAPAAATSPVAVIILAAIVVAFGLLIVFGTNLLGPKPDRKNKAKVMPYECGIPGIETSDTKVSIKFYLTAILFILFDIEIIFMYPWAIKFLDSVSEGRGGYMLAAMGVFVLLFAIGLIWEVKSKALEWK